MMWHLSSRFWEMLAPSAVNTKASPAVVFPRTLSRPATRAIVPRTFAFGSNPDPHLKPNALHAGRAEQISAEARMAYRAVADDIDERGLAGPQRPFERRTKLLRPPNMLTVTIHELEHPVVALVRLYFERI